MNNESSQREICAPEKYYKTTGVKGKSRGLEDQAWTDLCELINDETYPHEVYGYFPVYILWDLSSTTSYGKNIYENATIDNGQIYGKQASGSLIVCGQEIILQAKKNISDKYPAYPFILSRKGMFNVLLSGLAEKKVIALTTYNENFSLRIPLEDLAVGLQSHVSLRTAVAVQHPEIGSLRIEQLFNGDNTEIVQMIRAAQKEMVRQARQQVMATMVNNISSPEMTQELEAISSLRELNPSAYETAAQAIMKKYVG